MKQNWEPGNNPMPILTVNYCQEYIMGKGQSPWCWENWTTTRKRMKLDHYLTPYTEKSSKWIKDFILRRETMKLLERNIKISSMTLILAMTLNLTPKTKTTKAKKKKWDFIKLKKLLHSKANNEQNEKATWWKGKKICKSYTW